MKPYENDPLWKQGAEECQKAVLDMNAFTDIGFFKPADEALANVVLAYFSGKRLNDLADFSKSLLKLYGELKKQADNQFIYNYSYHNDGDHIKAATENMQAAEVYWRKFLARSSNGSCK